MPNVRKCKRTIRDEEEGLLFRWHLPRGSMGRTLLAMALTVVFVMAVSSLFHVNGKTVRPASSETARFVMLPPDSEAGRQWLDWALQNSPFPDRWEVKIDESLRQQIEFFDAELAHRASYEPLLRPMDVDDRDPSLPGLFDPARPRLPRVDRPVPRVGPRLRLESRVVARAGGALAERWGEVSWPLHELMDVLGEDGPPARALELLGLQRRFLVTVEPDGEVAFCQLVDQVESVLDGVLATRLRRHRLAPDPDEGSALTGGFVEVEVQEVPAGAEGKP